MTDREMLELAAKAADVRGFWVDAGLNVQSDAEPLIWDPLTDDGDALRLAVKLHMNILTNNPYGIKSGWLENQLGAPTWDGLGPWFWKEYIRDQQTVEAATRRAIVRAAAEIGSSM